MTKRDLYLCGDVHGEFNSLFHISSFPHSDVIVLGDFGMGFDKSFNSFYEKFEKRLEKNDITFYVMRGNHDDPSYFDGTYDKPRVKFIKDYEILELGGLKILPIGGATSIDIDWRIDKNKEYEHYGSSRRVWWENEGVQEIPLRKLPKVVDLVISHTAPIQFEPIPFRTDDVSLEQYKKILSERKYLGTVLDNIKTDYWYYGHFHTSICRSYNEMLYKGLNILEIVPAPIKKDNNIQGENNE